MTGEAQRARVAELAVANRERAKRLGIKSFEWLAGVPDMCSVAKAKNGQVFSYATDPLPGETECDMEWCRCRDNAVVQF